MPFMEKIAWLVVFVCMTLGIVICGIGCKSTQSPLGVYAPHGLDVPSPTFTPVAGNLTVNVQDGGTAVNGVTVLAVEPQGTTLTAVTSSGSANFNYNYIQVSPGQTFLLEVPTQGNYWNSPVNFNPATGNVLTFASNAPANLDSMALTYQGPGNPSYPYTALPTNIPLTLVYNQPGNLSVPLIVSALGLPAGWGLAYPTSILGEGVCSTPVSLTVPPQSYLEPAIQFVGVDASGATYISSTPVTIGRNYVTTLQITFTDSYSLNTGDWSGTFNFTVTPAVNALWQGTYYVNGYLAPGNNPAYSASVSFSGTGTYNWSVFMRDLTSLAVTISSNIGVYNGLITDFKNVNSFPVSNY